MQVFEISTSYNTPNNYSNYEDSNYEELLVARIAQNGRLAACATNGNTQKSSKTSHRQTVLAYRASYVDFPLICKPKILSS